MLPLSWILTLLHTLLLVPFVLFVLFLLSREARRRPEPQTSDELKRELANLKVTQKSFVFWYWFSGFWILLVADNVEWTTFGRWTGLIVYLGLMAIFALVGIIFRWHHRRKNPVPQPPLA